MHALSKYGRDEGLILIPLEDVISVQSDTRYLEKTLCLSKRNLDGRLLPQVLEGNMMRCLLEYAQKNGFGVSLELKSVAPEDY